MRRPENHATRAMAANFAANGPGLPDVSPRLVEALEEVYPARCILPQERLEDHLRYAGKVELVATLRARLETSADFREDTDEALDEEVRAAVSP